MAEHYLSDVIKTSVSADAMLSYYKSGVSEDKIRALKQGQISWEAQLKLQGLPVKSARELVLQFIQTHAKNNERCVLIVHGNEGIRGKPPQLKSLLNQWLPQFKEVIAFFSAQEKDGGRGAVYVLLKKGSLPRQHPPKADTTSYLVGETKAMERRRRLAEQQGERQLATVKAREHAEEDTKNAGPEGELQNTILQHPDLDSQRFDGVDPNLNPEPPLNSTARTEFDNEQREQQQEKQLRLGNVPKFNTAPTPRGP